MLYLYIFIGIVAFVLLCSVICTIIYENKKSEIKEEYFNKQKLILYEAQIAEFCNDNHITEGDSIFRFCEQIGYKIKETEDIENDKEAIISDKEHKTIFVDKNMSYDRQNFAIAHEVAHIITKTDVPAARKKHGFFTRSTEEQICDYIAAAILLPKAKLIDQMNEANFDKLKRKDKLLFIKNLL